MLVLTHRCLCKYKNTTFVHILLIYSHKPGKPFLKGALFLAILCRLNKNIPSHVVFPDGYTWLREDDSDLQAGKGVAIICRNDWKLKYLDVVHYFECIWCKIVTPNCMYYVGAVYHTPESVYPVIELIGNLSESCELILSIINSWILTERL